MATSNVNIINITNLPQAQDIVDGNYLIVQNDLGTQIIDWANVYVLKLDPNGNGSTTGTITAAGVDLQNALIDTLSAGSIVSNGLIGQNYANDYYNKFIFTNGIVTSAGYTNGSPEYVDLITNVIPAATSYAVNLTQAVFEAYSVSSGSITLGDTSADITFNLGLPSELNTADLRPADCIVVYSGLAALSSNPYVNTFSQPGAALQATLYLGQQAPSTMSLNDFSIKISKHYTV